MKEVGLETIINKPGVGSNLQDHILIIIDALSENMEYSMILGIIKRLRHHLIFPYTIEATTWCPFIDISNILYEQ